MYKYSNSYLVLHHDCTTAIEAFFSEKSIYSYCPIKDDDFVQSSPIQISEVINNKKDLLNVINDTKKISNNDKQRKIYCDLIRPVISNVDFESSKVIVEALKNITIKTPEEKKISKGKFLKNMSEASSTC